MPHYSNHQSRTRGTGIKAFFHPIPIREACLPQFRDKRETHSESRSTHATMPGCCGLSSISKPKKKTTALDGTERIKLIHTFLTVSVKAAKADQCDILLVLLLLLLLPAEKLEPRSIAGIPSRPSGCQFPWRVGNCRQSQRIPLPGIVHWVSAKFLWSAMDHRICDM